MNRLNFFLKLKNLLYIYQSEGYSNQVFLAWTKRHKERFMLEKKKKLDWTLKAKLIFAVSIVLLFSWFGVFVCYALSNPIWWVLVVLSLATLFFGPVEYLLVASKTILMPLDYYLRRARIKKAMAKLEKHKDLIVIGITGSYGKTTTARFLATILSQKYKVLHGVSSYNTPLGVAKTILEDLTPEHQILVVEMGADHPGDIKELANIVQPKIGILTGINEAHLEKFKTIENTIKTKFELAQALPTDGFLVINLGDKNVAGNYKKFVHTNFDAFLGPEEKEGWSYTKYFFDGSGINFDITHEGKVYVKEARAAVLGAHNIENILLGVAVAKNLGLTPSEVKDGIAKIEAVEHRLALRINPNGIKIIDDSYNGNPDGVRAALSVLSEFKKERKIFFTPGLVEVGESAAAIHVGLAKEIAKVADLVILIENSNTASFLEGFKASGYPQDKITIFKSSQEAYNSLGGILKSGDVILFQNDWTDNYD